MSKDISQLCIPSDRKYTESHEWAQLEKNDIVIVGLNDYAQDQLGDIVFIELPDIGDSFSKESEFAVVESVKAVSECYCPVSGEIVEINELLEDEPELINNDCYRNGWLVKIKVDNLTEMDDLLEADECKQST